MSLVATNPKYYFRRDVHDINQVRKGIIYVFSFCLNVEQKIVTYLHLDVLALSQFRFYKIVF